jgi:hypothetical protein
VQFSNKVAIFFLVPIVLLGASVLYGDEPNKVTEVSVPVKLPFNTNPTNLIISPRKSQSEKQQNSDQLECFTGATEKLNWDPYQAYDELVSQGFAYALDQQNSEDALVAEALAAATAGEIAGLITEKNTDDIETINENNDITYEAATGAAIGAFLSSVDFSFLFEIEDPAAHRAIARFERNLNKWEQEYSGCLKGKEYKIRSED